MSDKFSGFTSEDIQKVSSRSRNKENGKPAPVKSTITKTKKPDEVPRKQIPLTKMPAPTIDHATVTTTTKERPLKSNLQEALQFKPPILIEKDLSNQPQESQSPSVPLNNVDNNQSSSRGISLRDFEANNRMLKEQNQLKKEMLYKAIEQHSEKTAAEARKLHDIKKELIKLESELASDVALLRKQIEEASLQYMNKEKYYLQIETAFLKAKLDLHEAREKKVLLAEHLNIIIANNEDRKAKKLSELMGKVGLTED